MSESPQITVEIEDDGPCKKRMKAEIPAESVTGEIDANYKQLSNTIQIPGFRKGKVPRSLLERRYADQIATEVKEEMMSSSFHEEVEKLELRILGEPKFDNIEFTVGEPFRFEASFEVHPEFDMPDYKGLAVDGQEISVADADVERELESIRQQSATFEDLSMGEQKEDDVAVVDITLNDGDEELFNRPEVYLKIGVDRVDNIVVEELTPQLLGATTDDTLKFDVETPEDFPADLRNRKAQLNLVLRSVKRSQLPELDDEFAKRLGTDSAADLREQVQKSLEARRKVQEEQRQEELLVEQLVGSVEMELPQSLVDQRKAELQFVERVRAHREGKSEEEIEKLLAENTEVDDAAHSEMKQLFVLDRIAEQEHIFVTEDEMAGRLQQIISASGDDPEKVMEEYRNPGRLEQLRVGYLREKVRAFLRKNASVSGGANGAAATESPKDSDNAEGSES
ncbi:MAG: trigger factor [Planctomycetota bacterium]